MRALLTAMARELAASLSVPVHVCPEELLPEAATLPCVSLVDGALQVNPLAGGRREEELEAAVSCHLALHGPDQLAAADGLLEMAAQVRSALEGNTLGLPGLIEARLVAEEPSRLSEHAGRALISKRSLFRYLREVS